MNKELIDQIKTSYDYSTNIYNQLTKAMEENDGYEGVEEATMRTYEEGFSDALVYVSNLLGLGIGEVK